MVSGLDRDKFRKCRNFATGENPSVWIGTSFRCLDIGEKAFNPIGFFFSNLDGFRILPWRETDFFFTGIRLFFLD